jgi:hypothetical protein
MGVWYDGVWWDIMGNNGIQWVVQIYKYILSDVESYLYFIFTSKKFFPGIQVYMDNSARGDIWYIAYYVHNSFPNHFQITFTEGRDFTSSI